MLFLAFALFLLLRSVKVITINCKTDIQKLNKPDIPCVFKNYVDDYLKEMLLRFDCDELSNFGSIFVLENDSELDKTIISNAKYFINLGLITDDKSTLNITQIICTNENKAKIFFADSSITQKIFERREML